MEPKPGIFWVQGFDDGEWQNLQCCDSHDDAIAYIGPLLGGKLYRELRLVLAESREGRIEYTTLVKTRDGEIVSDGQASDLLPPPSIRPASNGADSTDVKRHTGTFLIVLIVAITGGLGIAHYYPRLAITAYEQIVRIIRPAPPAAPHEQVAVVQTPKNYADRLFDAVDRNDGALLKRLMASRPGDLQLDELRIFVDDGWGTGPRKIVDYALLGGQLAAADALLAAGATPSNWLRAVVTRNANLTKLKPAIALLNDFGAVPEISVEAAIEETEREFGGH